MTSIINNNNNNKPKNILTIERDDVLVSSNCDCKICQLTKEHQVRGITTLLCHKGGKIAYAGIEKVGDNLKLRMSGGSRDKGETLAECLMRELYEEIGLEDINIVVDKNNNPFYRVIGNTLILLTSINNINPLINIIEKRQKDNSLPDYMKEVVGFHKSRYNNLKIAFNNLTNDERASNFFKISVSSMFSKNYLNNGDNNTMYFIKNTNNTNNTNTKKNVKSYYKLKTLKLEKCNK